MKVAFLSLAICLAAWGQSPAQPVVPPVPPLIPASPLLLDKLSPGPSLTDQARQRIGAMSLKGPVSPRAPIVLKAAPKGLRVCAIPLLNAIPVRKSGEYRIQIVTPPATGDPMGRAVGLPACK